MKNFLVKILKLIALSLMVILLFMRFYLPKGTVILTEETTHGVGNQLFRYSAAFSLAKRTNSKLHVLTTAEKENAKYNKINNHYALNEFNIYKDNILRVNLIDKIYFFLIDQYNKAIYKYKKNFIIKFLRKILPIEFVNENNFFAQSSKNNKIFILDSYFESQIFFQDYKKELIDQFKFTKLSLDRVKPIIDKVSKDEAVCIHLRRGDMLNSGNYRFTSIEYQIKSINLIKQLVNNPNFFIFSDDLPLVKQQLKNINNSEFVTGYSAIEDLYIMSKCANNIITRSTFSYWSALLKENGGLVIAPYAPYNESYFLENEDLKQRYDARSYLQRAYPEDWILLDEEQSDLQAIAKEYIGDETIYKPILDSYEKREFEIYTGDRIQLYLCKGQKDFKPNLCFLNNKLKNHKPTVVTAYYNVKSKHSFEEYQKWAANFLNIPFDLIVYTDKENAPWIRNLRGNLPITIIEKELKDLDSYKFKEIYDLEVKRDPETYHTPELYIIWHEKVKFVNDALKFNPYNANFFVWCDIGTIRNEYNVKNNFTNDKLMIQDKITLISIEELPNKYRFRGFINSTQDMIGANIIIGDKRTWQIYNHLYDKTHHDYINRSILSGKDQTIINSMVIKYPKIFNLTYQDPRDKDNRWYYLLNFFKE